MKQIRSGQSFLYRTNGYDSTVVEIRMRDKVTGSYLQVALTNTARRFPYLTQKLVEKGGAYYLHRDDNSMVAVKTDKFRTLGSMATGYHLLDVTYTGTSEGIRLPGEPIPEEETAEPFSREFYEVDETAVQPVEHDGFALPESTSAGKHLHTGGLLSFGDFAGRKYFCPCRQSVGGYAYDVRRHAPFPLYPGIEPSCGKAGDLQPGDGSALRHRQRTDPPQLCGHRLPSLYIPG